MRQFFLNFVQNLSDRLDNDGPRLGAQVSMVSFNQYHVVANRAFIYR